MKISEQIICAYSLGHWIDDRAAKVLRDALQQAVAENLKNQHENYCSLRNHGDFCSTCSMDWILYADKLLRGEK